jgi:hypothetical protein
MMKKPPPTSAPEPICRTALGKLFVRRLMKRGARGTAEGILQSTEVLLRRKVADRTASFVLERSVEIRQMHLHLHWLLRGRTSGVKILGDFRGQAVAEIVKAAEHEAGATPDRRLAAAILKGYADRAAAR